MSNGLGRYHPIKPGATTLPRPGSSHRIIPATLTIASSLGIPTDTEIRTAIVAGYTAAGATPQPGDIVAMTELHYLVTGPNQDINGDPVSGSDTMLVTFTVDSTTYVAFLLGYVLL